MRNFTNIVIVTSALVLLVSFWNRNELPSDIDYVSAIAEEPSQRATRRKSFDVDWQQTAYRVTPEFEYDLVGMVVSYRHHENNSRMHRLAGDHLNMVDVCVVWGDNTRSAELDKIDFWNGIFTCNIKTRDQQAWDSFDIFQISNNHLISDDPNIRDRVQKIKVGDQIRVKGVLASYDSPGGNRGTSITRMDTGDGACETIYVESFEILRESTSYWRWSMYISLLVLIVSLLRFFARPFKSRLS